MNDYGIPNITTSYNGVKYAYEKEKEYNTEFIANCIEHGEEFYETFFAPHTYSKEQLKEIGYDLASGWGGECISVQRVLKHNKDNTLTVAEV